MSIESPADLHGMRDIGRVVALALDAMASEVTPGITTGDLDDIAAAIARRHGARSAPAAVAGEGSDMAARLAACAESAFEAALAVARAGRKVNEIGRAVDREVRRAGFTVVRTLTGHGVGRTIHEEPTVPNFYNRWQTDVLREGLVLTIEPIITAGGGAVVTRDDGWTVSTQDGSLSAHYEHTIVITRAEPVILTRAA